MVAALDINNQAPDFSLESHTGDTITLNQFMGNNHVILFFVRTTYCYACRQHVEQLARMYSEFQAKGAEVLVLVHATANEVKQYAKSVSAPFPVLADPDHTVYDAYGLDKVFLLATRTGSVMVKKDGTIQYIKSATNPWGWREESVTLLKQLNALK